MSGFDRRFRSASRRSTPSQAGALSEMLEARRLLSALKGADRPQIIDPIDDKAPQFNLNGRWTNTASGAVATVGRGMTLTYSVIPDGTVLAGGAGEVDSPSVFRARLNALYGNMNTWLPIIQSVFAEWSAISGITYVYEPNDDGVGFNAFNNGILGVRGDVRIGAHPIDGASNILAYNQFPEFGSDMTFDSNDLTGPSGYMSNISSNSLRFRNVMAHEHGHGLGFAHVDPSNGTKLMEPFVSTAYDGPQFDDTLAVQRQYGDVFEKGFGNNTSDTAVDRGTLGNGTDLIGTNTYPLIQPTGTVSTSTNADADWYKFTISSSKKITFTLAPAAPAPYLQGQQGGSTSLADQKLRADLQLQFYSPDGTTLLRTAAASGIGGAETISNVTLVPGTYFLKVSEQAGSPNTVQAYTLSTLVANGGVPLTGNLAAVAPDVRQTGVESVDLTFSEAIAPASFDLSDVVLQREGVPVDLTGVTITTSDNVHYTLGNLTAATSRAGTYLLTTTATTIETLDGRALVVPPADTWQMTAILGTSGDDDIRITKIDTVSVYFGGSLTPEYSFSLTGLPSMQILAGAGDDAIVLEFPIGGGAPFPTTGGLFIDGGTHANFDTLQFKGSAPADIYTAFTPNTITRGVTVSSPTITHTGLTGLSIAKGTFRLNADLNGMSVGAATGATGVTITMNVSQHLAALSIPDGNAATMPANGNRFLSVSSLNIGATSGKLDLFDNDLIATATPLSAIEGYIASAYHFGDWLGAAGIFSTTAKNNANNNTMLGAMTGQQFTDNGGGTFGDVTPAATDVLVKYTYFGDVDFNGQVDTTDYNIIDFGFLTGASGWANGDVDYNSQIDTTDYNLIDFAFLVQSGAL